MRARRLSSCVSFLFFLFLFILSSFAASSSVGKPPLTHADRLSVLVRLHSVPSRSLEKSHPSFFSPFPGPISPITSGIHTPTETVVEGAHRLPHRGIMVVRTMYNQQRDETLVLPLPPTPPTHSRAGPPPRRTPPPHTTHTEMPAENVNSHPRSEMVLVWNFYMVRAGRARVTT